MREKQYLAEQLLYAYVQCIDDDRLEEWPDFFTDDCTYKIIPRENHDQGLPAALVNCTSKGMLRDRITSAREANIYSTHFYRHQVSNVRVTAEKDGVLEVRANYVVFNTSQEGETKIYQAGRYVDLVDINSDPPRFRQKLAIYDTSRVQTLLVTPI
jgi:anthranilate 1,2-dioxygenase small subunit